MPREHDHSRDPHPRFPVDPDVTPQDLPFLPQRIGRLLLQRRRLLGVIAVGGAIGALGRWGVDRALPHDDPGAFPWSTVVVNVSGCLAIGVVLVLVVQRWSHRSLARPFLSTGVLGGFTTFSTYAVDARGLLAEGRSGLALGYLLGSVVAGLLAVVVGMRVTERVVR